MPTFAEIMLRSTPARAIAASAGVPSPFQGLASLLRGSQMADTSLEEAKARRRYVSEARELAQKVGAEWTTDIYKFVSDATPGIMLDEPAPGQKPTAEHDRQMKARIERDTARLSAARHRNVALPVQVAERVGNELALGFPAAMSPEIMSGSSLEDSSNPVKKYGAKGALKAADLVGMILAAKGIGGLTGLGGTASFSAQMGVQGAAPGIVAGNVGEAIGGGAAGAVEGAVLGKALGMVPQAGSALGRTAASAGTFGGLELLDPNAAPEDILLAMAAGGFAHGVTSEIPGKIGARRAEKSARLERAASEAQRQRDLASVLAEYRGEQQANEAFAEAGSRSPEVFVGEKGKIRQIPVRVPFKEYKAAKAKLSEQGAYQAGELVPGARPGSMEPTPLSLSDKAALELMDAVPDARTAPYEGPKVPLALGLRPGQIRPAEDRIPPDSQDARSETPPPEAPVVPLPPETPAPPERVAKGREYVSEDARHVTTPQGAAGIRESGFDIKRRGGIGGDDYGPGVYVSDGVGDLHGFWRGQLETRGESGSIPTEVLKARVRLKNALVIDRLKPVWTNGQTYMMAKTAREMVAKSMPEGLAKFDEFVASGSLPNAALGKLAREMGYDGLVFEGRGGNEVVAFRPEGVDFSTPPEQGAPVEKPKRRPGQKKPVSALSDVAALVEDYVPDTDSWSKASQNKAYDADLIRGAKMARKTLTQNKDEAGVVEELGGKRAEEIEAWRGWGTIGRGRDKGQMPYRQRDMGPAAARTIGTHRDAVLGAWEKAYGPAARSDLDARIEQRAKDISAQKDVGGQSLDDVTLGTMGGALEGVRKAFRRPGQRKVADPTGEVAEREFARPDLFRVPTEDLVVPKPIRGDYRGTGALDAGRSVSGRLERYDENAAEISARFNESLGVGSGNEGKVVRLLSDAGLNEKLSPDQRRDLGRAMRGTLDPGSLTGPAASAFRGFRAYLNTVIARARAAGLDVGELPNYFHQSISSARELRSGPKRERIIENMVHSRPAEFPTPESAATAIDAYVDVITKKGRGSDRRLAERMAKKQGITVEDALGQIALYRGAPKVREFGGFKERSEDLPFYDPDPVESFARYIEGSEMQIAEAHAFGPKMEKIGKLISKIEDPEVQEVTKQLVEFIRKPDMLDDPAAKGVLAEFRKVTGLKLGPMTTAKNLQQILAGLLATDTATFVRGLRASRTTFGEQVGLDSGATVGQAKRSLRGLSGGYQKYHTATGLIPSERWGRKAAANMGRLWAEKMTKQMLESEPGSRKRRFAERQLETMEINPAKIAETGGISEAQLDRAAFQMAENTFFGYRAKDVPKAFNENAVQRTIFQFKAFGAQQSRMVARQTIDELRAGHPGRFARNVAILALVYPMSGEVTNDIIAAVQGKKRPDGFQRWLEDAMSVGVTANFLFDIAQGAKYGNAAEAAAGPAFGSAADTGELLYSVVSKGELSESNRRKLVRMIPFIGPLIAYHVVPKSNEEGAESEGPKGRPGRVRPGSSRPGTRRPGRTRPARN